MKRKEKCKYYKNGICLITGWKVDGPHCNCCLSYDEKKEGNENNDK